MSLCTLADVITDTLQSPAFAMPAALANLLATEIIRAAAARGHAGADYYLPHLNNLTRAERNSRIRSEFNGTNLREVCRKYSVSKATAYRACRRCE